MNQHEADLIAAMADLSCHLRLSLERIHSEFGEITSGIRVGPSPEHDRDYRLRHLESIAAQIQELVRNEQVVRSLPIDLGPFCEVLERVEVNTQ